VTSGSVPGKAVPAREAWRRPRPASRTVAGIGIVAALHGLIVWFLYCGPVTRQVEAVPQRWVEVRLLRPEVRRSRPKSLQVALSLPAVPPPPFIPPPEVRVQTPPEAAVLASDVPQPSPAGAGRDASLHSSGRGRTPGGQASTPPQIDFSRCGKPLYPDVNAQGTTLILFTMDVTGAISESEVAEPSGPSRRHRLLDRLAREFVLSCRGTPGTVNGQPVPLRGLTPIVWQLTN
jgi:protein TonB